MTILYEDGVQQVLLNGKNVSTEIRQEIVGNTASKISVIKEVREKLVALQRQLAAKENVVMDGRDIGTQVLPDATVKIYLTASAKERAKRRYLELKEKGMPGELDQIEADIIERDNRDMNREISRFASRRCSVGGRVFYGNRRSDCGSDCRIEKKNRH